MISKLCTLAVCVLLIWSGRWSDIHYVHVYSSSPVLLLLEMFPDLGAKVVRQQVKRLHGDMDRCIQVLLELSEKMSQKHPHKVSYQESCS